MPSGNSVPLSEAGSIPPDLPGNPLLTFGLLGDQDGLRGSASNVYDGPTLPGRLSGAPSFGGSAATLPDGEESQPAPLPDDGEIAPTAPVALTPILIQQSTASHDPSQEPSLPNCNNVLSGNAGSVFQHGSANFLTSSRGREINSSQGIVRGVDAVQIHGGDLLTGGTILPSNGSEDAGKGPILGGVRDHGQRAGTLLGSGKTVDTRDLLLGDASANPVASEVVVNPLSDGLDASANADRLADHALTLDANGILETAAQPRDSAGMVLRWLSGNWTEGIRAPRMGEVVAYSYAGTISAGSFSPPSGSVAVEKLANQNSVGGTDHAFLGQVHLADVGKEALPETQELLVGHDSRMIETLSNATNAFASPRPINVVVTDTGSSAAAELVRRRQTLGSGITALTSGSIALPALGNRAVGKGQNIAENLPSAASGRPVWGEVSLSLGALESAAGLELFQYDVAAAGPGSGDVIAATTATTSIYQPLEGSSIWTILTTYALVIMPRQRRYQPTILVVDPDDASRDAMNVVLVRAGYFVLPASSVRDAWGMVRTPNARIDLVLMDPHLPDVSGIHLCARLRELSPTLPVMVCAGEVEPSEVAQLQQLGVRYYLRKPIAIEELLHTVKAILL